MHGKLFACTSCGKLPVECPFPGQPRQNLHPFVEEMTAAAAVFHEVFLFVQEVLDDIDTSKSTCAGRGSADVGEGDHLAQKPGLR